MRTTNQPLKQLTTKNIFWEDSPQTKSVPCAFVEKPDKQRISKQRTQRLQVKYGGSESGVGEIYGELHPPG